MPVRLTGLAPVVSENTVILVLGSFPGRASLASGQYYGHPQNQFWRIQEALFEPIPPPGKARTGVSLADETAYAGRCQWLLARGVGLWDVYASCEREGSLDSKIRAPVANDFVALARQLPQLACVVHNGGESYRQAHHGHALGLPVEKLPSTSPANAAMSFTQKLKAWRTIWLRHGLI
jgi:TDG/mug DNA glycosylase family protein